MPVEELITELRVDLNRFTSEMKRATNIAQRSSRDQEQAFGAVNGSVRTLSRSMGGLKSAIAGIGFGLLLRETVRASNRLNTIIRRRVRLGRQCNM